MEKVGAVGSRLGGVAFLASVVLLVSSCREAPDAISMAGIAIDPHPEVRFLSIQIHPGLVKFTTTYNFFGDGRVQIDRFHASGPGGPVESHTTQLTKEEQWRLLADFLEGGLFRLDPKELQARDLREGRSRPSVADGGSFAVSIALVHRGWGGFGPRKVVQHRFALSGSALALPIGQVGPDTREHEALRRLMELIRRVQARAERIPPPRPVFRYSFPQDDRPVLVLTAKGMQMPFVASLSLYASGTAVIESSLRTNYREVVLAEESRDRVLRDIDEGGLALYDEKTVAQEQKRLAQGRVVANSADSPPVFTVQLRVLENSGTGTPPEELSRTMVVRGPDGLAQQFPSIPAFKAIADLEQLLWEMESLARNPP